MTEDPRTVARRVVEEVINGGDMDAFEVLVDPAYREDDGTTRENYRQGILAIREAFPDLVITIEDEIAEGDKAVIRLRWDATHLGEFRGIAPTGRRITMTGIGILRVVDGRLVERWNESDVEGLMEQLRGPGPG